MDYHKLYLKIPAGRCSHSFVFSVPVYLLCHINSELYEVTWPLIAPIYFWQNTSTFLSSAYVESPGSTSRKFVFLCVFHSVSNFLGIQLAKTLVSGRGSDIPLIQDIEPSNSIARLSHATLRFFSLAEQCHTQNFYLRCFKSDFDAVKSKFDLLIE